jgi:thioredoxin 1
MNKTILIPVLVVAALGVIGFIYSTALKSGSEPEKSAMDKTETNMEVSSGESTDGSMKKEAISIVSTTSDSMMVKPEPQMKKDEMAMKDIKPSATSKSEDSAKAVAGTYATYSANAVSSAKTNKVVLFFHAAWCPSCRALDAEITAKGVKSGVTILKVYYDTANTLKAKYGVTTQHTLVQVTSGGELISKWTGGDLESVYSKIK